MENKTTEIIKIIDYQLVDPVDEYDFGIYLETDKYKCHEQCEGTWCTIQNKFIPYPCHFNFVYDKVRYYGEYINPDEDLYYTKRGSKFIICSDKKKYKLMVGINIIPIALNNGWGEDGICRICRTKHKEDCILIIYYIGPSRKKIYICKNETCINICKKRILEDNPNCVNCSAKVTNFNNIIIKDVKNICITKLACSSLCAGTVCRYDGKIKCSYCSEFSPKLIFCKGCFKLYCSDNCKQIDWKTHKDECIDKLKQIDRYDPNYMKQQVQMLNIEQVKKLNVISRKRISKIALKPIMAIGFALTTGGWDVWDKLGVNDFTPNQSDKMITRTRLYDIASPVTYKAYNTLIEKGYVHDKSRPFPVYISYLNKLLIWTYPDKPYEGNDLILMPNLNYLKSYIKIKPDENNSHIAYSITLLGNCFSCGGGTNKYRCEILLNINPKHSRIFYLCGNDSCFRNLKKIMIEEKVNCYECKNPMNPKWIIYSGNEKSGEYVVLCSKNCAREYSKTEELPMSTTCNLCGNKSSNTTVCSKCKSITYCSNKCLEMDIDHKMECDGKKKDNKEDYFIKSCDVCSKYAKYIQFCNECKDAKYCSKECQSLDWKTHKLTCNKIAS